MSKKTLTWLFVFSVIINISALATIGYHWFESKRTRFERGRSGHQEFLVRELGLTEQQSAQIQKLRSDLWQKLKPLKSQLDEERRIFFQMQNQDSVDIELLYQSIDRISELQRQMQRITAENMLASKAILTPEQRKKFLSLMESRMKMGETRRRHPPKPKDQSNQETCKEEQP